MYGTVPIFLKTLHFLKFNQQVLNKNKKIVNKAKQSEFYQNKFWIKSWKNKEKSTISSFFEKIKY